MGCLERIGPPVVAALLMWGVECGLTASENDAPPPAVMRALTVPGIHNLFALGTNVFSGSTPEGEEGFAALAKLGVKTIVSVDGAKPEVELARKHGLRYVHLPHGYDGISTNLQLQLAKAGQSLPGPIYVHCHHGKHRGPAAAAVICMADYGWTHSEAADFLHAAGTSTNYVGLYETVRKFQRPSSEQLRAASLDFPELAIVSGLVDTMVAIDERWENLKAVRAAGYQPPKDHPNMQPASEGVILWEHFREVQRLPETAQRGADVSERLKVAETAAKEVARLLRLFAAEARPEIKGQLAKAFDVVAKSCSTCHQAHRDAAGVEARQ